MIGASEYKGHLKPMRQPQKGATRIQREAELEEQRLKSQVTSGTDVHDTMLPHTADHFQTLR
jgi:hypothetical protein